MHFQLLECISPIKKVVVKYRIYIILNCNALDNFSVFIFSLNKRLYNVDYIIFNNVYY